MASKKHFIKELGESEEIKQEDLPALPANGQVPEMFGLVAPPATHPIRHKPLIRRSGKPIWAACLQIILMIICVLIYFLYIGYFGDRTVFCQDYNRPGCPDKYFSMNYSDARDKFLHYHSLLSKYSNIYHLPIYNDSNTTEEKVSKLLNKINNFDSDNNTESDAHDTCTAADDDSMLYTDIMVINENSISKELVIHVSGIHGVEGHAGSGVQMLILDYLASVAKKEHEKKEKEKKEKEEIEKHKTENKENEEKQEEKKEKKDSRRKHLDHLPHFVLSRGGNINDVNLLEQRDLLNTHHGPKMIFIHLLNPYGFKYGRRTNENNVDLNRNLKTDEQWKDWIEILSKTNNDAFNSMTFEYLFNQEWNIANIIEYLNSLTFHKSKNINKNSNSNTNTNTNIIEWLFDSIFNIIGWMYVYFEHYIMFWLECGYYLYILGYQRSSIAISVATGQSHNPNGLQYVGEPFVYESSHLQLINWFEERINKNGWNIDNINKISFIDTHTGMGNYATDTLLVTDDIAFDKSKNIFGYQYFPKCKDNPDMKHKEKCRQRVELTTKAMNGTFEYVNGLSFEYVNIIKKLLIKNSIDSSGSSSGKEKEKEKDIMVISKKAENMDVFMVTQEFGTVGELSVFHGLRNENILYNIWKLYYLSHYNDNRDNNNDNNENDKTLKQLTMFKNFGTQVSKQAYFSNYVVWKSSVVKHGFTVWAKIMLR